MVANLVARELLLCCARTRASEGVVARTRELAASEVDWEYLFLLARRHSVVPLLYLQLERHASDLVPREKLSQLKRHYLENSARNTILTAELCRLITLFAGSGIEAIPYKGPVLALFAYDNLALRRFVDLDIIVNKNDVLKAREILLAHGYAPAKSLSLSQQELLLHTQHNLQFSRDNNRLIVELHWEVAPHLFAETVDAETLWQDLVSIDLNGTQVKTLSAEDLLFSLCVHGSRHLWERLGWICDVAELISRRSVDWNALLKRATAADSERMFLLGLYLAEHLLDAPLPPEVKQRCDADERLPWRVIRFALDVDRADDALGGRPPMRLRGLRGVPLEAAVEVVISAAGRPPQGVGLVAVGDRFDELADLLRIQLLAAAEDDDLSPLVHVR